MTAVDDVNQYAGIINNLMVYGTASGCQRIAPNITLIRPTVAIPSENIWASPARGVSDVWIMGGSKIHSESDHSS